MQPKKFNLSFLPLFEQDLNEIIDYIALTLKNPEAAMRLVDDVEIAIMKRLEMPLSFSPYPSAKKRKYPYYRIYVVIDDTMEVRRILYQRRDFDHLWFP